LTPEEKEKLDKEFIQNMKEHFGASSIKDIWTEWHD
jgi:D-alanyl-lipoteichoic acid acyltransferase DltB (MBOAT superfamily)